MQWNKVTDGKPPVGLSVMTKIDDGNGIHNKQVMHQQENCNLWFAGSMLSLIHI